MLKSCELCGKTIITNDKEEIMVGCEHRIPKKQDNLESANIPDFLKELLNEKHRR